MILVRTARNDFREDNAEKNNYLFYVTHFVK